MPEPPPTVAHDEGVLVHLAPTLIDPHPQNPRLDHPPHVVAALAAQFREEGGMRRDGALLVRPRLGNRYQCVAGHLRLDGAGQARLARVWAWVREMSDHEALRLLALDNVQEPLTPLELALHYLDLVEEGIAPTQKQFAIEASFKPPNFSRYLRGARVLRAVEGVLDDNVITACRTMAEQLFEISRLDDTLQLSELVRACVAGGWSKRRTAREVARRQCGDNRAEDELAASPKAQRTRNKQTQAPLIKAKEGYTATAVLMGRRVNVYVPCDLSCVDLTDDGVAAPQDDSPATSHDDGELLRPEDLATVLEGVVAALPDDLGGDIEVVQNELHLHCVNLAVLVKNWGSRFGGVEEIRVYVTWWKASIGRPPGAIVLDVSGGRGELHGQVQGRPTRGQFHEGCRDFLLGEVLHRTHGVVRRRGGWVRESGVEIHAPEPAAVSPAESPAPSMAAEQSRADLLRGALINLGFRKADANKAVAKLGPRTDAEPLEVLVREALALLR